MRMKLNPVGGWRSTPGKRPPLVEAAEFKFAKGLSAPRFRSLMSNYHGPKPVHGNMRPYFYNAKEIEDWWNSLPELARQPATE